MGSRIEETVQYMYRLSGTVLIPICVMSDFSSPTERGLAHICGAKNDSLPRSSKAAWHLLCVVGPRSKLTNDAQISDRFLFRQLEFPGFGQRRSMRKAIRWQL